MNIAAHWTGPDACRFPATSRPLELLFGVCFKNYRFFLHVHAENCFLFARRAFTPDGAAAVKAHDAPGGQFQTGASLSASSDTQTFGIYDGYSAYISHVTSAYG